jgi:hypothetical protein
MTILFSLFVLFTVIVVALGIAWFVLLKKVPQPIDTARFIPTNPKIEFDKSIRSDSISDGYVKSTDILKHLLRFAAPVTLVWLSLIITFVLSDNHLMSSLSVVESQDRHWQNVSEKMGKQSNLFLPTQTTSASFVPVIEFRSSFSTFVIDVRCW